MEPPTQGRPETDGSAKNQDAADTECFGFNILKAARMINLIAGTGLTVICGVGVLNIFQSSNIFKNLGLIILNFF